MRILVTGGSGFIGSNFIGYLLTDAEVPHRIEIVNFDALTYAGKGGNIEHMGFDKSFRYKFVQGSICDKDFVDATLSRYKPDIVFNFAAESHVDRSENALELFMKTNADGTENLLEASKKNDVKRFVHISTDEIYGSIKEGSFTEEDPFNPGNNYASSKVEAEKRVAKYRGEMPIIVTRSANNYGPYQFPEKILPLFITNLIDGKKVPLMWSDENPGLNVRDWLNVKDNCRAIWYVSQNSKDGEVYNIAGDNERTNIEMTKLLLSYFKFGEDMIEKVPHRKQHDFRYSISNRKLKELGFQYKHEKLEDELTSVIKWYEENQNWWRPLKNG